MCYQEARPLKLGHHDAPIVPVVGEVADVLQDEEFEIGVAPDERHDMEEHPAFGRVPEPQAVAGLAERLARKSGAEHVVRLYVLRVYRCYVPEEGRLGEICPVGRLAVRVDLRGHDAGPVEVPHRLVEPADSGEEVHESERFFLLLLMPRHSHIPMENICMWMIAI